ncbi:MAG TPA: AAA family ATPase, partial [bacterium]
MRVKSIKIKNFMSFKDFAWESIDPALNIIVGPNGSGKTNFFNAFRIFSELLNERSSSELLSEIKGFAHFGKWGEKIELSMSVEFENKEKKIILEFIRTSLIGTLSNKGIPFDSISDEKLLGFLTVDDIADIFKGDLIAEYDFYSGRWNVRYESEAVQCMVEGDHSSYILASENGEGLIVRLREKLTEFIKANFDETQIKHVHLEQITTSIQIAGKPRAALNLTIQSNHYPMKSLSIFRNLISDTNTSRGYSLGNLFGWLLKHAFVFTDNIREMPKTNFSSKEIEDEQKNDSLDSGNIAFVLHGLKNGDLEDREKFSRIKENFKELTEGLEFDVTTKYISTSIPTGHRHDFS